MTFKRVVIAAILAIGAIFSLGTLASANTPGCPSSSIVPWLDTMGNGAAGSTYYNLQLSNFSGHTCTLKGYPTVSAIGLKGFTKGAPSSQDPVHSPATVSLANGTFATVILRITDAANYGPLCGAVHAAGLLVTLPGSKSSSQIPFPFQACTNPVNILSVEAIQKGVLGG